MRRVAIAFLAITCSLYAEPIRIFFARMAPSKSTIFIANSDGKNERPLFDSNDLDYKPSWSPDARGSFSHLSEIVPPTCTGLNLTELHSNASPTILLTMIRQHGRQIVNDSFS